MAVISKIEICPFVQDPFDNCYCFNLTSRHVSSAIYYCGNHYADCEIYKKKTACETKHSGRRPGQGVMN